MFEPDYKRFVLEADFQEVLSRVKRFVFLRTDCEEYFEARLFNLLEDEVKLKFPKTVREWLGLPWLLALWVFVNVIGRFARRYLPSGLEEVKKRDLIRMDAEWERVEDWIRLPEIRGHILNAEVPDGFGDDPFIIAERIARGLLKDESLRSVFKFGMADRIAATAIFLAEIGFDNYRRTADPDKWPSRPRREF